MCCLSFFMHNTDKLGIMMKLHGWQGGFHLLSFSFHFWRDDKSVVVEKEMLSLTDLESQKILLVILRVSQLFVLLDVLIHLWLTWKFREKLGLGEEKILSWG
jgi:hypothetical protein